MDLKKKRIYQFNLIDLAVDPDVAALCYSFPPFAAPFPNSTWNKFENDVAESHYVILCFENHLEITKKLDDFLKSFSIVQIFYVKFFLSNDEYRLK